MTERLPRPRAAQITPQAGSSGSFTPFSPALARTPIAGPYLATREWLRWFQASYDRAGGASAPSNAQLDEGLASTDESLAGTQDDLAGTQDDLAGTQAELDATQASLTGTQADLVALTSRVDTLEADVAALEATVADQETRLAALEAWRTALVAALPALVVVTPVPTLGVAPATATILRDDLTANWEGNIDANDAGVAAAVNAVVNALAL